MQILILRVANHADDLKGSRLALDGELTSERVASPEVVPRHGLIHDCHARAPFVFEREVAASDEWCAERLEIPRRHDVQRHTAPVVRIFRKPWHGDELTAGGAGNWRHPSEGHRTDARDRSHPVHHLPAQGSELRGRVTAP